MTGFIKRRIVTNETLGERLRKIREGQGLDFSAVETATNIKATYLECLEDGDYDSLPGEVYVKNFLKVYGVFLGMDESKIAEQYEKEQRADDYRAVARYAAGGRDLFGNKPKKGWINFKEKLKAAGIGTRIAKGLGWKQTKKEKLFFRNIVLSQIIIKGIIALLILGVFFYLGLEIKGMITPPDLTVLSPTDNLIVQEAMVEVAGVVESGAILKINESEVIYDREGNFSEAIDLREGLNEIAVSAKKKHSREIVIIRRIMVEKRGTRNKTVDTMVNTIVNTIVNNDDGGEDEKIDYVISLINYFYIIMTQEKKSGDKKADDGGGKAQAAQTAIDQIKERFGEGSIMRLGEARRTNVDTIPTGCLSLDIALGVGGVPRGRIIEIFGPEMSGKSTLAQHIVAEVQKKGGIAAYVDAEHALDPDYARKLGVKVDDLFISQPDTGEQALEIVETLVRSNGVDIIVIDSVAALVPKKEIEGEMGDQHMALQARLMSQALRKLAGVIGKTNTVVIFINQIRMKIGVFFGNPETTPGGTALKFYSSVRIEVRRAAMIKMGEKIIGNRVRCKVVKNKVAAPFRACEFDIMYNKGISLAGDLIDLGVQYEIITKSGNSYSFNGEKLALGREAAKRKLEEDPKLMKEIRKMIWEKARAMDKDNG